MSKQTNTDQKRRIQVKRDQVVLIKKLKETPKREKADSCKRELDTSKETSTHQKRPRHIKRELDTSKET